MIGKRLSHYLIQEQVGRGGMGVVYRAHDEQLDRDVAIKVLPSRLLADEAAHKRFRKEALSLARLNHPNIATVHEFGSENGIDFLVTEFIAGVSLDAKLARGPLPPAEIVRLGIQIAEGLAEAHRQGIVHRDLKPGNIRLTTDGRVKILDFGLAQIMPQPSDQGDTVTLTQSQETSGTLPYMSPEQLSGEKADARSDMWAAGAVLYEMSTGKRPFPQGVPALLINAILNQTPEAPSKLNAAVPAALEAVILRALERDRAQRYQSAKELAAALEAVTAPASASVPIQGARRPPWMLAAIAASAIVIAAIVIALRYRNHPVAAPAPPVARRRSIAVLGFKNLSGNSDKSWLSTALSEMLTTELNQGNRLRTIPEETVAQMKASLSLPDADSFGEQTLSRIRQNLGSDDVVVGSYLSLGNGVLRVDVRLQDAVAGDTLTSVSEKGNESEIDDLVSKAGAELRAKLGVGELTQEQSAAVKGTLPSNAEAARLYSEGLQRMRVFDDQSARNLLEQAAALEPGFAPAHAALAEAWSVLGYDQKAKDQAKQALALSANASREDRLLIEGRAHEILAESSAAIESYSALWQFFPDNIDYGLLLTRAQADGGHASDAQKTLSELRKLPASEADRARLDLTEAGIDNLLSDFKGAQSAAERAMAQAKLIGAGLLQAQAMQRDARASERMGQFDKAVELSNQARELYSAAGNQRAAAACLMTIGDVLYDKGDFEGAKKHYESALPEFQAQGAENSVQAATERLGNVYYSTGRFQEAKSRYEQCVVIDRRLNDPAGLASSYGNLANTLDGLGDLTGSMKMQEQALQRFRQVGDRRGAADTLNNIGNLLVEIGDFEKARKYYEQAFEVMKEISYVHDQPDTLGGLGDTYFYRGDLVQGRKYYEQALAMTKEVGDEDYGRQAAVALAAVDVAEKKFTDGERRAGDAAAYFEKNNSIVSAAWANAILARCLLGEGKVQDAQNAAAKSVKFAQQSGGRAASYEAAFAHARVEARMGKTADARKELEDVLRSTHKFGYGVYEYQARLAIAQIDVWSGSPATDSYLAALEKDARENGALLVANQAKALQSENSPSETKKAN